MSRSRIILAGLLSFAFATATTLVAPPARATPNFPGAIQGRLQASQPPECAICHVCGVTGRGTVNTPWGSAMRSRGLEAYNESSLGAALGAMERDRIDSDGDGTIDVEAVKMAKDPNPPACEEGADPTIPVYGCFGRLARSGDSPPGVHVMIAIGLVAGAAAARRRRNPGALNVILLISVGSAALSACQSGAPLAPRAELFSARSEAQPPRMPPIRKSELAQDLERIGLDPQKLPAFEALAPRQLRGVMSTFTRSLGFSCTDCHDPSDYRVPTSKKIVTVHMWNEMTRHLSLDAGGPVYCDSCHQGQGKFLDRHDKKAVATWMSDNFTGKLKKSALAKDDDVECETCHGEPFQPSILGKWVR